jgi:hypothetical protein
VFDRPRLRALYHIGEKLKAASRDKGINLASRPAPAARLSMMGL